MTGLSPSSPNRPGGPLGGRPASLSLRGRLAAFNPLSAPGWAIVASAGVLGGVAVLISAMAQRGVG